MKHGPAAAGVVLGLFVSVCGGASGAASARLHEGRVILKNAFVEIVFVPDKAGRCVSLKYRGLEYENGPYGSLEDRIWELPGYDLPKVSYRATILQSGPEAAVVRFVARPRSPGYTRLEFQRTVTLRAGRSDVEVVNTFVNQDRQPLPVGFWIFTEFQVPGRENVVTFPSARGLDRLYVNAGREPKEDPRNATVIGRERWVYDNPRGFLGWHTPDKGPGLAITFDLARLSMLYNWTSTTLITTEFVFNELPIAPGRRLAFTYRLVPFQGLPSLDGAAGNIAGCLALPATMKAPATAGVHVTLVSGVARKVAVTLRAKRLPRGQWATAGEKPLALAADQAGEVAFNWTPKAEGTWVVSARIAEGARMLLDMEKPVVVGAGSADYVMTTDVRRMGKEMAGYRKQTKEYQEDPARRQEIARRFQFFRAIDESVATPHVAWGKPLAGGPVRALLLPSWYAGREVVELAQRLDLKYEHVALMRERDWSPFGRKGTNLFEIMEQRLVERLKGGEPVVALSSSPCPWPDLRASTRKALLQAVDQGKGLVYCGQTGPVARAMGKQFVQDKDAARALTSAMPAHLRRARVRAGLYGKGRVVLLHHLAYWKYNSLLFHRTGGGLHTRHDQEREAACSVLAKSLVWAARRDTGVAIRLPARITVKSENTGGKSIAATIARAHGAPPVGSVDWFVQPPGDVAPIRVVQTAGEARLSLRLPHLQAGPYVLYAIARQGKDVLDWTCALLNVTTDSTLAVTLDKTRYEPSDTAGVTVEVHKAHATGLVLRCDLADTVGRLMATETRPLGAGAGAETVRFAFPMGLAAAKMAVVRATLLSGRDPLVAARATASIHVPRTQGFRYIPYGSYFRETAELVGAYSMMGSSDLAARLNLDNYIWGNMPDFTLSAAASLDQLIRRPCLSAPDYVKRSRDWTRKMAAGMALYGDLALIITDEWNYAGRSAKVTNFCHSPTCEGLFREYLRQEYGTLDRLNASWGSQYKTWGAIHAPRWEDTLKSGRFIPWIDKRRAQESVVAAYLKQCGDAGKQVYPDFRISLSGTKNPTSVTGYDWWKVMNALDAVSLYGGPQIELARSFARPRHLLTRWVGYDYADADPGRGAQRIWAMMFSGLNGVTDFAPNRWSPLFWPDLSPRRYGRAVAEAVAALHRGSGELIVHAAMADDGVAILYSHPSTHSAAAEGARGRPVNDGTYVNGLSSSQALLRDVGLQYRYVAADQVTGGVLDKAGYRLLVIPFSRAISPRALAAIRGFVQRGGVVLADMCPGIEDQHGKPYATSPLDEVFGVKRPQHRALYRQGDVQTLSRTVRRARTVTGSLRMMLGEADVTLDGAVALGRFKDERGEYVPALIEHRFGKGRAILLNFGLADYQSYRAAGVGGEESVIVRARAEKTQEVRALLRGILAAAGIKPRMTLTSEPPVGSRFATRFRSGDAVYVGLSAHPDTARKLRFSLSGMDQPRRHVYDVRAAKFLGHTDTFAYEMKKSFAEVLALMPNAIGRVSLRVAETCERGHAARLDVSLAGWTPPMGHTVFRVEVRRPDGSLDRLYTRNLVTRNGSAGMTIPFALSDPAGDWRVAATEVVSGHRAEAQIHVR